MATNIMTSQKASLISSFPVRISVKTDKCHKDTSDPMVRDIIVLNEDKMIISDFANGVKCFDSTGTPLGKLRRPSPSTSMTRMSENKLAYVVPFDSDPVTVFVDVDLQSGRLHFDGSVPTPINYRAIASIDEGTWAAGTAWWNGAGAIDVLNRKGEVLRSYNYPGTTTSLLQCAVNLLVNLDGDFVVTDGNAGKIIWVDPKTKADDNPIRVTFDGEKEGLLEMPCGVACDSVGRVYVADAKLNRVIVLSSDGKYIQTLLDSENGELCKPFGIDWYQDQLYVAEEDGVVKVFQLNSISS